MARPRRLIVYVDGFNLYHGMHDEARCRLLWLDPVRLVRLLRPKDDLQVVRYFTAPLLDNPAPNRARCPISKRSTLSTGGS